MKFYHKGVKKSNKTSASEGCLFIIGFGAIIFFLTLLDDVEDLKDYFFELVLVLIMGISLAFSLFGKKGKLSNFHVTLKNNYFTIEKVNVPIENIIIDIYQTKGTFIRYHLRDTKGEIAIFSVVKDDLLSYFEEHLPNSIKIQEETSRKHDGPFISVLGSQNLFYNLDSGKYTINAKKQTEISFLPKVYTYDPKYKLGKPLLKK